MAIALALLAAGCWGGSDYAAGIASRRWNATVVVIAVHAVSVAMFVLFAPTLPLLEQWSDVGWGAAAGASGGLAALLLFKGLSIGTMSIIAPVTAAGAALVPVVFGLLTGESVSPIQGLGFLVAILAIALASGADPKALLSGNGGGFSALRAERGVGLASLSGVGFGLFYVFIGRTSETAQLWPLLTARGTSVVMLSVWTVLFVRNLEPHGKGRAWIYAWSAGVLDALAALTFLLSTYVGALSVVSVLSSLYPGMTVMLARHFDAERITRLQVGGLVLTVAAVLLLSLG